MNWVQCDRCEEWFHLLCVGLAEDEVSEEEEYECFNCKQHKNKTGLLGDHKPNTNSIQRKSPSVYGMNYNSVSVFKSDPEDNVLVCNEEIEVAMESSPLPSYGSTLDSFERTLGHSDRHSAPTSSKITQFSYETDDSSQDEVKLGYSVGADREESVAMATQILDSNEESVIS